MERKSKFSKLELVKLIGNGFLLSLQVDRASSDLKNTNVRLRDTVNQVF